MKRGSQPIPRTFPAKTGSLRFEFDDPGRGAFVGDTNLLTRKLTALDANTSDESGFSTETGHASIARMI
jgi:hypothetical protein